MARTAHWAGDGEDGKGAAVRSGNALNEPNWTRMFWKNGDGVEFLNDVAPFEMLAALSRCRQPNFQERNSAQDQPQNAKQKLWSLRKQPDSREEE